MILIHVLENYKNITCLVVAVVIFPISDFCLVLLPFIVVLPSPLVCTKDRKSS